MSEPSPSEFPALRGGSLPPDPDSRYAGMIDALRDFLDRLAGARIDEATSATLATDLEAWTTRLAPLAVPEADHMFGRVFGVAGHGQTMCPAFAIDAQDATALSGRVTFGRYFHGANGAAHGGAVALLFDEVLGIPANAGATTMARTAYLHVDYRSVTPVERELQVAARVVSIDGRKRIVRGELRDGDRLCAEAEGLFVELRPGQP